MSAEKKKSSVLMITVPLLLFVIAGVTYLTLKIFAPVELITPETTPEAAESCQAKITKMLIDETLAFKYKRTTDIPFSELEINSWLKEKLQNDRVFKVYAQFEKSHITFVGLLNPFVKKMAEDQVNSSFAGMLQKVTLGFRIVTEPVIRSNRIYFETKEILLGKLPVPPKLMPDLPDELELNPFEKQIRTIKETRVDGGLLLVTVYAD